MLGVRQEMARNHSAPTSGVAKAAEELKIATKNFLAMAQNEALSRCAQQLYRVAEDLEYQATEVQMADSSQHSSHMNMVEDYDRASFVFSQFCHLCSQHEFSEWRIVIARRNIEDRYELLARLFSPNSA